MALYCGEKQWIVTGHATNYEFTVQKKFSYENIEQSCDLDKDMVQYNKHKFAVCESFSDIQFVDHFFLHMQTAC